MSQIVVTFTRIAHRRLTGLTIDDKLVALTKCLDRSWFRTQRRARMPDRDRLEAKERRIARGVRLAVYWYHHVRANSTKQGS